MSTTLKEYQFFRSFSAKIENWPLRKAEAIWRKMRERKIAGNLNIKKSQIHLLSYSILIKSFKFKTNRYYINTNFP